MSTTAGQQGPNEINEYMAQVAVVGDIINAAETHPENRPPAPAWFVGDYPQCDSVNDDGDPTRIFDRQFVVDPPDGWVVSIECEDVLTASGAVRGPTGIGCWDEPRGDLTARQAKAYATALLAATAAIESDRTLRGTPS